MTLTACGGDDDENTAHLDDYQDVTNPGNNSGGDQKPDPGSGSADDDDVQAPTPPVGAAPPPPPVGTVPPPPPPPVDTAPPPPPPPPAGTDPSDPVYPTDPVDDEPPQNRPPSISGKPAPQVVAGAQYSFTPAAVDPDMDMIVFSVDNLPVWASFDPSTGRLTGTPTASDQGIYSNITISVSDGERTVALSPFTIEVVAYGHGSATLSWTAPTMRTDGTTLDNLAGYRIYWGTSIDDYTDSATIDNPGVTTYVIEGLVPATYYFVATAYDADGFESQFSGVASKTIE